MTPKFTLTTPNGKHKLIGFEHTYDKETLIERTDWLRGQRYNDWKAFDLSDITEEQAKDWGYANGKKITGTFQRSCAEYFSAKQHFENVVKDNIDSEQDLSNILLIVTQTPER